MYELLRTEDFNTYIIRHFQCDSDADLDAILTDYATTEIPKNALHAGWTAVVIGSGSDVSKPYVLDNTLANWSEIIPFPQIDALEEKVDRLEGKTTRLLYSGSTNPTASDINTFVTGLGYTSPFEGIAVVVAGTYHIWHYYENDGIGWRDDGLDTITPFTNSVAGSILGSADDGKIGANNDGTGYVNGWSNKLDKITTATSYSQVYAKATDGSQTMLNANANPTSDSIPIRFAYGHIKLPNQTTYPPSDDDYAISKRYAGNNFVPKITGTPSYPKAYVLLPNGDQGSIEINANATADTIVRRTGGSQINVPYTPTAATSATSKDYVDSKLNATLTQLQDGTYSLTFGV